VKYAKATCLNLNACAFREGKSLCCQSEQSVRWQHEQALDPSAGNVGDPCCTYGCAEPHDLNQVANRVLGEGAYSRWNHRGLVETASFVASGVQEVFLFIKSICCSVVFLVGASFHYPGTLLGHVGFIYMQPSSKRHTSGLFNN